MISRQNSFCKVHEVEGSRKERETEKERERERQKGRGEKRDLADVSANLATETEGENG